MEIDTSALWDSIKTRVRSKPAFLSAFCLFLRTNAVNSRGVGGQRLPRPFLFSLPSGRGGG